MSQPDQLSRRFSALSAAVKKWMLQHPGLTTSAVLLLISLSLWGVFHERPLRVRAIDEAGNPVAGVEIWYDRVSAGGWIGGITGASGKAEVIIRGDKLIHSCIFNYGKARGRISQRDLRWPMLLIVRKDGIITAGPDET